MWMARALRLASLSLGMTWPNPGVGCVLVRDGQLIGQGRHTLCGDLHAETSALVDCERRFQDPRGATAYVTLAPCTRQGRQPPCVDALIAAGVVRVVAAIADPHQDDARAKLAAAGVTFEAGCLGHIASHIHGGFLTRIRHRRPRITGKWAQSRDGFIAAAPMTRTQISDDRSYALMRRRRRAFDAILVGAGTVAADNPALTTPRPRNHGRDPGPLRVVVARDGRIPGARLRDGSAPTLVIHQCKHERRLAYPQIQNIEVADAHDPTQVATELGRLGVNDLMVEGGAMVHRAWLSIYDRLEIYVGDADLGDGVPAPPLPTDGWIAESAPQRVGTTAITRWTRLQSKTST